MICYQQSDPTKPILTGIATRKDLSPSKDSPGVYTDVFKIKNSIQKRLGIVYQTINFLIMFKKIGQAGRNVQVNVFKRSEEFV